MVRAGIRLAVVWRFGAATPSNAVGEAGLDDLLFAGLETKNWALVLAGCAAAALLALVADALLGLIERGIAMRRRGRIWAGAGLLAAGIVLALAPIWAGGGSGRTITVGAKNFSEQ